MGVSVEELWVSCGVSELIWDIKGEVQLVWVLVVAVDRVPWLICVVSSLVEVLRIVVVGVFVVNSLLGLDVCFACAWEDGW